MFTETKGLTEKFGKERIQSPLAEASIVGTAIGLALPDGDRALKYNLVIRTAMMQIVTSCV